MTDYRFATLLMIICITLTAGCDRNTESVGKYDIKQAQNDAFQYFEQANTLCVQGEYKKAIESCNKALELNPDFANVYSLRGRAYTYSGEYEKAIMDFDTALRLNPDYILAHFFIGSAYAESGDKQSAVDAFRAFIQYTDPDMAYLQEQAKQKIEELENAR
ncbi:MAG: tetratricopeptide repeat protein [Candidatus Auribacterota bacterium]|jgi:tetratricopeptide (TPR) repeat protein|nr:tetratricopeptide repeat protein [Candidatus Auribacterota bacterium]